MTEPQEAPDAAPAGTFHYLLEYRTPEGLDALVLDDGTVPVLGYDDVCKAMTLTVNGRLEATVAREHFVALLCVQGPGCTCDDDEGDGGGGSGPEDDPEPPDPDTPTGVGTDADGNVVALFRDRAQGMVLGQREPAA